MYNIHLLPGSFGDAILIEYGKPGNASYILIDGGPYFNFEKMATALKARAPQLRKLELLIVTHVDIDHIDGVVRLLNQKSLPFTIEQIWFNGYEQIKTLIPADVLAVLQGDYLSMLIKDHNIPHNTSYFKGAAVMVTDYNNLPEFELPGGMSIKLVSPGTGSLTSMAAKWEAESKYIDKIAELRDKFEDDTRYSDLDVLGGGIDIETLQHAAEIPDKSIPNESSIAFIGTYESKSCLFSGDAPSDALLRAIKPMIEKDDNERLKIDAWKVAHHGSKKSTGNANGLMQKIDAKKLLISSDGAKYGHPNPETIAKLLKYANRPPDIYFNYRTEFNKVWDNEEYKKEYNYETFFPEDEHGITVSL